ncbi:short chain dehydrogenase [Lineolata rhizophorae]|uniref:Short chain dehydrogenase n=1 Tax=Lineolata rhizophorae TaxID=578093 RepID=A0A6A6PCH4_9PEZI|nr:short chain dehydrogenase [Lineolata rhizophorae]
MPYSLKGRNVLVTGGSRGLGAVICHKFAAEGCNVIINYVSNAAAAEEVKAGLDKEFDVKVFIMKADCGVTAECEKLVRDTIDILGGVDIIIGNAGWTRFSTFADLDALSEDEWDKCWATNVKGQMALLRAAMPTFNANPDGGAVIYTSSIAGVSQGGSSMAYAVTKAAQLQLMKCLAATQGPKVRVNAVLPGLLLTDWGMKYSVEAREALQEKAALKRAVDLGDCADAFIMLAKNTSITGMKVQVDIVN